MLCALSIRDIVLIEQLDLALDDGLCVLTGETGAGKSVLLDALALALGRRGDSGLVRQGAKQGVVVAEFHVAAEHPMNNLLRDHGVDVDETLILRRILYSDGPSRAFINDQSVGVNLLRQVGEALVEVHGQHDTHGLLNPSIHRGLLDGFARLTVKVAKCRNLYEAMTAADAVLAAAEAAATVAQADEEYYRHALVELDALAPEEGEEDILLSERQQLKQGEKIVDSLKEADDGLNKREGVEVRLRSAIRSLERVTSDAPGLLEPVLQQLDRASEEVAQAVDALARAQQDLDLDPNRQERLDDRLFALRDVARKHRVSVNDLPRLHVEIADKVQLVNDMSGQLSELSAASKAAREAYAEVARELTVARQKAALKLDKAVMAELKPLALDKAVFMTSVETGSEDNWGPEGADRIAFQVATNPGQELAAMNKIASGGELSRFMLALRVVAQQSAALSTMIFDEVDSGVGGATADKVGERLAKLAEGSQVLLVTHSPQVAARGDQHLKIAKTQNGKIVKTDVHILGDDERLEEVARMLAGARITDEARAAAEILIAEGRR
jgi:DNA repair protein RecN (Recombination protein N)